jgi:serine protease AprX
VGVDYGRHGDWRRVLRGAGPTGNPKASGRRESRSNALWGSKGGRGAALVIAALVALALPLAAPAADKTSKDANGVYIPDSLYSLAQSNGKAPYKVIVQGSGNKAADKIAKQVAQFAAQANKQLADAAKKAADAAKAAQDKADKLAADALKKQQDAADAAAKGAKDAAKKAADAAKAQADANAAQDAANQLNADANAASSNVSDLADRILQQQVTDQFSSISGVAATLTGDQIVALVDHGNGGLLSITPDAPATVSADPKWSSGQLWPFASAVSGNWGEDKKADLSDAMPTIAIVDSGVEDRGDFGTRLLASVNLTTRPNNSPGDGRGHGTFVAGIAAGSSEHYTGASPAAKLVSIDVMDDEGVGFTSDIINACQWILANKDKYNIRVANFSLHSAITAPFYIDPLDRAVEQLWFNGIVVVTAAGNYGLPGAPSGVLYSPGDDPFVITVGAADLEGTPKTDDDTVAPWSAWGYTGDGFAKPELSAPGRYMVGPVPLGATLVTEKPENVVAPGYMQLSGTSFAAPVVAGAAADVLARHPNYSPDQVKGALMVTAKRMSKKVGGSGGVGEIAGNAAAKRNNPPNPNLALGQFIKTNSSGGTTGSAFDSASWLSAVKSSASWNSASWNSASWNDASWDSASWNSASWNSASWNSASWNSASWLSSSYEDAAEGDASGTADAYTLDPTDIADLLADPTLGLDPSILSP